jgi:hypothetical protein
MSCLNPFVWVVFDCSFSLKFWSHQRWVLRLKDYCSRRANRMGDACRAWDSTRTAI